MGGKRLKPKQPTECPLTREEFFSNAKDVSLVIDGKATIIGKLHEFSSGSFGWYANDKFVLDIGGVNVKVQPSISLTVIGSKPKEVKDK